ncbi:MAG: ribosome-associated translation inhibitor RaiA [Hyphomonadaceae bacterium]|nr:ribosome-associated translation inhibitor RaiA [Hyphomonadaceae bacterium]MBC6412379.1 ribosome-associated translation inhibitor RaiA [Hyphomonadaceae bacterium]
MNVQIASKGIDVSPALHDRIHDRLEDMIDKYIRREGDAQVSISKDGATFRILCSVHLPSGATMEATGRSHDAYVAADESLEHMEKRLRRYKRRLKDHQTETKEDAFNYVYSGKSGAGQ